MRKEHVTYSSSYEPQRLLYQFGYHSQELCTSRPVYDPMIARECQHHYWLNYWLPVKRDNPLNYTPYRKNSRLGRINNSVKGIYPIHSQVANGECASLEILWT